MDGLSFSIPEIASTIGVTQCTYLMVHIALRAGFSPRTILPLLYFFVLSAAFLLDFAKEHIGTITPYYDYFQWAAWFSGPPLSVLLVIQMAYIKKTPALKDYWVLLLLPLAFVLSTLSVGRQEACANLKPCEAMQDMLTVTGLMAGTISLLVIFSKKNIFSTILKQRNGKERYWVIFALIIVNVLFLGVTLVSLTDTLSTEVLALTRTVMGLAFVYLVSTSLLRIYPQAVRTSGADGQNEALSEDEQVLARKIERLMTREKVYQEPTYSRTDLARECDAPETAVSRVINVHFQRSFPQLMNEYRIEDAKRLLSETDAPVKVIAENTGFNSLSSFNRVFKEVTGETPSRYRKSEKI